MESAEVKEYTQRAAKLRSEGRLEEAVIAARKATSIDSEDPNAWWQLGLALDEKDGGDSAVAALEKVTELAPDFSAGWCELGAVHLRAKRNEAALEAYEQAIEVGADSTDALHIAAFLLRKMGSGAEPGRRLAVLRRLFDLGEIEQEDSFALAYLLGEAGEAAESVKVYERHTKEYNDSAAFFNLALAYRSLGRDLDAMDALVAAAERGFKPEKLANVQPALREHLLGLRKKVSLKTAPYLPQESWFRHYINPFTLLNVDPEDIEGNPKALLKAKQALLREIELEEGKVDWMPGLVIDKSNALARLVELDDSAAWDAHSEVFRNEALNAFLMRGDLRHFLIDEDGSTEAQLPHLLPADLLQYVGPVFAAQYDEVLSRAVESADLVAVECLMDGRRWVSPAQQEACVDSTRRLMVRLAEPLKQVAETASKRPITRAEVDRAFNHGSLGNLLALLPIEFYEIHNAVGVALRSLSVSYYNREMDAEGAKAILALGRVCAQKSTALAHQMAEDVKTLDGFIAEERSKEAHLSFKDRDFSISKAGVSDGKRRLSPTEIAGVRWGLVHTSAQPLTCRLSIAFQARRGDDIAVSWTTSQNLEEQKKLWGKLVDATMEFILDAVLKSFREEVRRAGGARVGPLNVFSDGVELTAKGWFSDKTVRVPWRRLSSTLTNGAIVLRDTDNPKATAELPCETTFNAYVLHILANRKEHTNL